jgi:hypothetical protein
MRYYPMLWAYSVVALLPSQMVFAQRRVVVITID